jgi:hypothetical protein
MTYSNNGLAPLTIAWKNVKAVHTFTSDEGEVGALAAIILELSSEITLASWPDSNLPSEHI